MKQIHWLVMLLMLAIVFPGCREDEAATSETGNIRFALNPSVVTDGQGRKAMSLPDGASVYVSIRRISGDEIYNLEQLRLLKIGNGYISEPVALEGGNYELTDFLVADGAGNVVYAAPKEGSDLAVYVDDPLPQAFAVTDNAIAEVSVQVLSTDTHPAEQFGYVAFDVDVAPFPFFRLSAFRRDSTGTEFTSAYVYLLQDGDTVYHRHLKAGTQPISFPGNPQATYTLIVREDGLTSYYQTFVLRDLLTALNGMPLQVTLYPAFTFTALFVNEYYESYQFWVGTHASLPGATFTIHWGDGSEEVYTINGFEVFIHVYASHGRYPVTVTGDLAAIRQLGLPFDYGAADNISLLHLPGLEDLSVAYSQGSDALDVSHNPNLQLLSIAYSSVRHVDISHNPKLRMLDVTGDTVLSVPALNQLISDLHSHAVNQQTQQGEFYLETSYDSGEILGPPSPEAMAMLVYLSQDLGWTVRPLPGIE
jgi:hypothetical protein